MIRMTYVRRQRIARLVRDVIEHDRASQAKIAREMMDEQARIYRQALVVNQMPPNQKHGFNAQG